MKGKDVVSSHERLWHLPCVDRERGDNEHPPSRSLPVLQVGSGRNPTRWGYFLGPLSRLYGNGSQKGLKNGLIKNVE